MRMDVECMVVYRRRRLRDRSQFKMEMMKMKGTSTLFARVLPPAPRDNQFTIGTTVVVVGMVVGVVVAIVVVGAKNKNDLKELKYLEEENLSMESLVEWLL